MRFALSAVAVTCCLVATSGFAQTAGPAVAVVPFTGNTPDPVLPRGFADLITVDLISAVEQCDGVVVEWARRDDVIAELALAESGLIDPATAPEQGHLLDPTVFITGVVTGDARSLSWKIEARSAVGGTLIATDTGTADDFFAVTEGITNRLVTKICAAPRQNACVAQGEKATLTARYTFANRGQRATSSDRSQWSASRQVVVVSDLLAATSEPFPSLLALGDAAQAGSASAAAAMLPDNLQAMAQGAEQAAAKCGDDSACMMREMMRLIPAPGAASAAAPAAGVPPARYQRWESVAQKGSYRILETQADVLADPACPNLTCTYDLRREGSGAFTVLQSTPGKPLQVGPGVAEIDCAEGTLAMMLPVWIEPLSITETVRTDEPDRLEQNGSRTLVSLFRAPDSAVSTVAGRGAARALAGSYSLDAKDDLGRPGKLTVDWQFRLR